MAKKLMTHKQIAQKLAEYCEELFFQNTAFKAVLTARGDITLVNRYAELVLDSQLKAEIHARFDALRAGISAATADSDLSGLLAQIPEVPKVE